MTITTASTPEASPYTRLAVSLTVHNFLIRAYHEGHPWPDPYEPRTTGRVKAAIDAFIARLSTPHTDGEVTLCPAVADPRHTNLLHAMLLETLQDLPAEESARLGYPEAQAGIAEATVKLAAELAALAEPVAVDLEELHEHSLSARRSSRWALGAVIGSGLLTAVFLAALVNTSPEGFAAVIAWAGLAATTIATAMSGAALALPRDPAETDPAGRVSVIGLARAKASLLHLAWTTLAAGGTTVLALALAAEIINRW